MASLRIPPALHHRHHKRQAVALGHLRLESVQVYPHPPLLHRLNRALLLSRPVLLLRLYPAQLDHLLLSPLARLLSPLELLLARPPLNPLVLLVRLLSHQDLPLARRLSHLDLPLAHSLNPLALLPAPLLPRPQIQHPAQQLPAVLHPPPP